jgi:hypothetical protein
MFAEQVDGQMNAQPLYLTMATSNNLPGAFPDGAAHNAVYVATQNGTIYAIDLRCVAANPGSGPRVLAEGSTSVFLLRFAPLVKTL